MKNLFTFRVESSLGAVYISLSSLFFISLLFISVKNFETDVDVMSATQSEIKIAQVSQAELILIREWLDHSDAEVSEGQGYRYLLRKYPDRPWLD